MYHNCIYNLQLDLHPHELINAVSMFMQCDIDIENWTEINQILLKSNYKSFHTGDILMTLQINARDPLTIRVSQKTVNCTLSL